MSGGTELLTVFQRDTGLKSWTSHQVLAETFLIRALCGPQWLQHLQHMFTRSRQGQRVGNRLAVERLQNYEFSYTSVTPDQWRDLLQIAVRVPQSAKLPVQVQQFYDAIMKVVPTRLGAWTAQQKVHRFLTVYTGENGQWQQYWKAQWSYLLPDTIRTVERFLHEQPDITEDTLQFVFSLAK